MTDEMKGEGKEREMAIYELSKTIEKAAFEGGATSIQHDDWVKELHSLIKQVEAETVERCLWITERELGIGSDFDPKDKTTELRMKIAKSISNQLKEAYDTQ